MSAESGTSVSVTPSRPTEHSPDETQRRGRYGVREDADRAMAASPYRLSFRGMFRSEWIKLTSLRSIRVTAIITVVVGLGMSFLIAMLWKSQGTAEIDDTGLADGANQLQAYLVVAATVAAPFLALIFGIIGVLSISSEYSSGMILSTLTAAPRRIGMVVAKGAALASLTAATAATITVLGMLLAAVVNPEAFGQLVSLMTVTSLVGTTVYLVAIALMGFGFAGMTRSTAGAIAMLVGLTFVLPVGLQMLMMTGWTWVPDALQILPGGLGQTLTFGIIVADVAKRFLLSLLGMLAWVALAVIPAVLLIRRRDAR